MCNVPKKRLDDLCSDFKMKNTNSLMKKILAAAFSGELEEGSGDSAEEASEEEAGKHPWVGRKFQKAFGRS